MCSKCFKESQPKPENTTQTNADPNASNKADDASLREKKDEPKDTSAAKEAKEEAAVIAETTAPPQAEKPEEAKQEEEEDKRPVQKNKDRCFTCRAKVRVQTKLFKHAHCSCVVDDCQTDKQQMPMRLHLLRPTPTSRPSQL